MRGLGISSYSYPLAVKAARARRTPFLPLWLAEKAAALGVNTLQFGDNLPLSACSEDELDELARLCVRHGLSPEPGTVGIETDNIALYAEISARLRAPILRTLLPAGFPAEALIARLLALRPALERGGVMLAIENYEAYPLAAYRRILDALPSSLYGLCLDTANSLGRGETPEQFLDVLGDRVCCLHIKDVGARRLASSFGFVIEGVPVGSGIVDIPALLRRTAACTDDYSVILEQWPPDLGDEQRSEENEAQWAEQGILYLSKLASQPVCGE